MNQLRGYPAPANGKDPRERRHREKKRGDGGSRRRTPRFLVLPGQQPHFFLQKSLPERSEGTRKFGSMSDGAPRTTTGRRYRSPGTLGSSFLPETNLVRHGIAHNSTVERDGGAAHVRSHTKQSSLRGCPLGPCFAPSRTWTSAVTNWNAMNATKDWYVAQSVPVNVKCTVKMHHRHALWHPRRQQAWNFCRRWAARAECPHSICSGCH